MLVHMMNGYIVLLVYFMIIIVYLNVLYCIIDASFSTLSFYLSSMRYRQHYIIL